MHGPRGSDGGREHAPTIVVVDYGDHWDLVFRGGIQLKHAVGDAGVARDAENRGALIRSLRADAALHGCSGADGHGEVGSDGAVLISARKTLSGTVGAHPAAAEDSSGPAADAGDGLFGIDIAFVEEIVN